MNYNEVITINLDLTREIHLKIGIIYNDELNSPETHPEYAHGEYWLIFKKENHFILQRDKIGIIPCYFHLIENTLYISSNLDCLIKKLENEKSTFKLDLNSKYCNELRNKKFECTHLTPFLNIVSCPPATRVIFHKKKSSRWSFYFNRYWNPLNDPQIKNSSLKDVIKKAISDRITHQSRIGLFLSGGLDSSILYHCLSSLNQSSYDWQAYSIYFKQDTAAHEPNLNLLNTNIHKIPWTEQTKNMAQYSNSSWPKTTLYSPGLGLFLPLFNLAQKNNSKFIWTGLGGDDIFSEPELYNSKNYFKKLFFYTLSFFKKNKGSFIQRLLRQRIELSGAYPFGINCEQQVAMNYNMIMSYPLLDDRIYSWWIHNFSPEQDHNLGKFKLRESFSDELPYEITQQRSLQNLSQIHREILGAEKLFPFCQDDVIISMYLKRMESLINEKK